MSALDDVAKMLKKQRNTGTDYTGTVTRIDGGTAYVRLTGSKISDTPCAMTISANIGDTVRIRVSRGRAWITGNDTKPPTNDTEDIRIVKSDTAALEARLDALEKAFFGEIKFYVGTIGAMTIQPHSTEIASQIWGSEYFKDTPAVFVGVVTPAATAAGYASAIVARVDPAGCDIMVTNTHPTQACTLQLNVIAFGYRR